MKRLAAFIFVAVIASCSKDDNPRPVTSMIPDVIDGVMDEINLITSDLNTPDKGVFFIYANNVRYEVEFSATSNAASNSLLLFETDTILTDQSREYSNLGADAISYNPVRDNKMTLTFNDGRKITGVFDVNTSFGGVFGQAIISQWRDPMDPTKPTQKAKDDLTRLVNHYRDKDGPGPQTTPQYLFARVTKT